MTLKGCIQPCQDIKAYSKPLDFRAQEERGDSADIEWLIEVVYHSIQLSKDKVK